MWLLSTEPERLVDIRKRMSSLKKPKQSYTDLEKKKKKLTPKTHLKNMGTQ